MTTRRTPYFDAYGRITIDPVWYNSPEQRRIRAETADRLRECIRLQKLIDERKRIAESKRRAEELAAAFHAVRSKPLLCPSCGSREWLSHAGKEVCAYCRSDRA